MGYDVRDCCLAFLGEARAKAEGIHLSAKAAVLSARGRFSEALEALDVRERRVERMEKALAGYKGKRSPEAREKRAKLRDEKQARKKALEQLRDARYALRDAEGAERRAGALVEQVGGVYTQVERTWIPGCVVRSKPTFENLIPEV